MRNQKINNEPLPINERERKNEPTGLKNIGNSKSIFLFLFLFIISVLFCIPYSSFI